MPAKKTYSDDYVNGYRDGYRDGYQCGITDGQSQGFRDAKHRAYLAADALEDPSVSRKVALALADLLGGRT